MSAEPINIASAQTKPSRALRLPLHALKWGVRRAADFSDLLIAALLLALLLPIWLLDNAERAIKWARR